MTFSDVLHVSKRGIYTLYKKHKVNFTIVYTLTLLSICGKIFYAVTEKEDYTKNAIILLPLLATVIHLLLFGIARLFLHYYSYTGFKKNIVGIDFNHLSNKAIVCQSQRGDLKLGKMDFNENFKRRVLFPDDDNTKIIAGEINYLLFMDTPWSGKDLKEDSMIEAISLKRKIERNISHMVKNYKSILLIKNRNQNWLGFSHVFPVNQYVWNKYLDGNISDVNFPDYYICSANQEAFGIIIFSIGNVSKIADKIISDNIKTHLSDDTLDLLENLSNKDGNNLQFIFKSVLYHLNEHIEENFQGKSIVPVMIQIEEEGLRKIFIRNNFIKHDKLSKDQCDIYVGYFILDNRKFDVKYV